LQVDFLIRSSPALHCSCWDVDECWYFSRCKVWPQL